MLGKAALLLAPMAAGAFYFGGGFDAGYKREVAGSPAQVMAALQDLDIREQPGSPGTDPSRSGGVAPVFRTEPGPDGISFVVMSGDQVATRMTARLEPLDGGARTRVTALVERGDAPDDRTSPAFRSVGITMGLFTSALDDELNELERPPSKTAEECAELERNMFAGQPPAEGLKAIVRVHQMAAEMERNGCSTRGNSGEAFRPMESQMGPAPAAPPNSSSSSSGSGGSSWGTQAGPAPAATNSAGWGTGAR
jgi:hypothetical protein